MKMSLKKRKVFSWLVLLALVSLLAGCAPAEAPAEPESDIQDEVFTLTLAHFQPATHPVETTLIQGWIDALAEASDGRIQITSFPGETLLPGTEIYEGVVDGAADIGHSAYAYTRGRFPVMETFLVPGISFNNAYVSDQVAMEGIRQLQPAELDDVKHLFTFSTGRGDLLMQLPIRSKEDLVGVEVGVTAGQFAEAIRLLGGTSAVFTMPEHYEVISRGLTQGVLAPMEVLRSFRIGEITGHVTVTPFLYNQLLFMVMNKDTWNALPPDLQQTVEEVTEAYYEEVVAGFYDRLNEAVLDWIVEEELELEIITLEAAEAERWIELLYPILQDHQAYLEEKGLPGEAILDTVQQLADDYNARYGDL